MAILIVIAKICLVFAVVFLTLYAIRHYLFSLYRLSLRTPRDTMELVGFHTPRVSVLVPMHNEEDVAADILQALVDSDYSVKNLEILAIDDRSEDRTGEIIDEFAAKYPVVKALHRKEGKGGKAAVLEFATPHAAGEILILFDADYYPGRAMLKLLVAPFADPEVGAVMGRVVPHNAGASLLAGLLALERAAGYQIGQQARYNLGFTPLFGGTVGGVRVSALQAVKGWNMRSLTEDTDLTFRLRLAGWKVAYVNRAECYEEVPEAWPVRRHQIIRWAMGHTDCLHRFWTRLVSSRSLSNAEKIDSLFVLGCYWTGPVLVLGWLASLVLLFSQSAHAVPALVVALAFVGYQMFGSQATFFELGAASLLDGSARRIMLMPLNLFNFFASTAAINTALFKLYSAALFGLRPQRWRKTKRFRNGNGGPNGNGRNGHNGNGGNGHGGNGGNGSPARKSNGGSSQFMQRNACGLYEAWGPSSQ